MSDNCLICKESGADALFIPCPDHAAYNVHYLPRRSDAWGDKHARAMHAPTDEERPIVHGIRSWVEMARQHRERFESGIGQDYYACDPWAAIGVSLRSLLNMSWGSRLDTRTLDAILVETLDAEGYDVDMGRWKEDAGSCGPDSEKHNPRS